jgi:protein required for attachment to host cells
MAESIWIVIGDSTKVKAVFFEHPFYQADKTRPDKIQNSRYHYRVIREFDVRGDVELWSSQVEKQQHKESAMDSEETAVAAVPMSDEPEIAALVANVSVYLSRARSTGKFDRLILVAPRDVLGTIKLSLTPELRERVAMELEMELTDADPETVRANLPADV